jgi:serine/threonine protein phosphatase PrpC
MEMMSLLPTHPAKRMFVSTGGHMGLPTAFRTIAHCSPLLTILCSFSFFLQEFASMEDTVYCGVYDGHGPYGHLVARRVRDSLPSKLLHYWQEELAAIKDNSKESETDDSAELCDTAEMDRGSNVSSMYESAICDAEDSDRDTALFEFSENALLENLPDHNNEVLRKPPMFQPWMEAHLTAYRVMDKELRSHPLIDCFCSGTTAVTVLKQGKHLVIGNVGDSRAIMGTRDENGVLKAIQLTVDLKPNLPGTCPFHFHIEKVGPYLKLFML